MKNVLTTISIFCLIWLGLLCLPQQARAIDPGQALPPSQIQTPDDPAGGDQDEGDDEGYTGDPDDLGGGFRGVSMIQRTSHAGSRGLPGLDVVDCWRFARYFWLIRP